MKKVIALIILAVLIFASCSAKDDGSKINTGISEGKSAPDFVLKNVEGKEVKLSDYKGKTVVVNFFGVWCPWCVKEMPGFVNVFNEYKDKNVELLVVDVGDSQDKVNNYLKENGFGIKPVMDVNNKISDIYGVNGFPTSFIIDEKGVIKRIHRGYMDEESLRTLLKSMVQ